MCPEETALPGGGTEGQPTGPACDRAVPPQEEGKDPRVEEKKSPPLQMRRRDWGLALAFLKSALLFALFVWGGSRISDLVAGEGFAIEVNEGVVLTEMDEALRGKRYEVAREYARFVLEEKGIFSPQVVKRALEVRREAEEKLNSKWQMIKRCARSVLVGVPEDTASLVCVLASDMTWLGDLRDVVRDLWNRVVHDRGDNFVLALSALGLASPVFDALRVLWKSGVVAEPLMKVVAKSPRVASDLYETFKLYWKSGAGLPTFSSVVRYADDERRLRNLLEITKREGTAKALAAVRLTYGAILDNPRKLFFKPTYFQLARIGLKDLVGKGGYVLAIRDAVEGAATSLGGSFPLVFGAAASAFYLLVNAITPFRRLPVTLTFAVLFLAVGYYFGAKVQDLVV